METLVKVEPGKHMYRWYSIGIQNTLVDGIAVIYGWGSLKSPFQQWRTIRVDTLGDGEKIVARRLATNIRKGYIQKVK
jgi:hypothetical protein